MQRLQGEDDTGPERSEVLSAMHGEAKAEAKEKDRPRGADQPGSRYLAHEEVEAERASADRIPYRIMQEISPTRKMPKYNIKKGTKYTKSVILVCEKCARKYLEKCGCLFCKKKIR